MADNSFWKMPDVTTFKTPLSIIKEQTEALTAQTKGVLRGEAEIAKGNSGNIFISLVIVVPTLNEYRFRILKYRQPIGLYPGVLSLDLEEITVEIESEEQFVDAIKNSLGSDDMQRIIGNLLSQAGIASD